MTERLYYEDCYLTEFDARVTALRAGNWAALDRSAFYPTSGGQPFDTGTLTGGGLTVRVVDVEADGQTVWHRLEAPLPVGAQVRGTIDWARRWDHMQQHAGDHMLAGAAWQTLGAVTIGLHLGKENSTIDLTLPDGRTHLTPEETEQLETLVNRRVQQDDPIHCWFPSPEELARLPLRKPPTVTEHVRVVAMGDYEMVACGGTHPRTTGQIGPIKILSCAPTRGKMRLCFVAGMRAVRCFQQAALCAQQVSDALSADWTHAAEALAREREHYAAQRKETAQRLLDAALTVIRAGKRENVYAAAVDFADPDTLLRAASLLIAAEAGAIVLLSCPRKDARGLVFARGLEAGQDMAALMRQSGARGGGKPELAQGSAADDAPLRRALDMLNP